MPRIAKVALPQVYNGWPGHPNFGESKMIHEFHRKQLDPFLAKAGEQKADIICFCENAMNYGNLAPEISPDHYEDITDGLSFQWATRHARNYEMNIIMPITGFHDGQLVVAAVVIGRKGELIGVFRKVHLMTGEKEKGCVPGEEWPVFEMDFGKIGIMICADAEHPESARILMLNGAEIIFFPNHWGNSAGENWLFSILKGTAAINGIYLAQVNLAPKPEQLHGVPHYMGLSGVIGTQGEWLFTAGMHPGLAIGEINLDIPTIRKWHGKMKDFRPSYFANRRTETYGRLVNPEVPIFRKAKADEIE